MNALKESIFNDLNERANRLFEDIEDDNTNCSRLREGSISKALDIAREDDLKSENDIRVTLKYYLKRYYSLNPEEIGPLFEGADPNWGELDSFCERYPNLIGALIEYGEYDEEGVEAIQEIAADVLSKFKARLIDRIKSLDF